MAARSDVLQDVLDAAKAAFEAHSHDPRAVASLSHIFGALQAPTKTDGAFPARLPVCDHLAVAVDPLRLLESSLRSLAEAFLLLEPSLAWRTRSGDAAAATVDFAEGHANAMIVGPGGLEQRQDVWLGVSLLAPHIRYPNHTHAPEETYLVMSQGSFRQNDGPWFEPGVGGSFYNPPGILHAMRTGHEPLFAMWALWAG